MGKSLEEQRQELQQNNKNKYCSNRILTTIERSLKTTFIGALDDFEKFFGEIWGHGKDIRDKTKEELEEYEIWIKVRESILDRGNNAIKICKREIRKCNISDYDDRPFKYVIKTGEE